MKFQTQTTGTVEQTRNSKYQKLDSRGEPIYHVGIQGLPDLAGKKVRVTVEVIDEQHSRLGPDSCFGG